MENTSSSNLEVGLLSSQGEYESETNSTNFEHGGNNFLRSLVGWFTRPTQASFTSISTQNPDRPFSHLEDAPSSSRGQSPPVLPSSRNDPEAAAPQELAASTSAPNTDLAANMMTDLASTLTRLSDSAKDSAGDLLTQLGLSPKPDSKPKPPHPAPICLICYEPLTPEEFESQEALVLDCACKGDMALRHYACIEKWTRVKGDNICDICKQPIRNIPEPPPLEEGEREGQGQDTARSTQDAVYDCIRISWIVMVICILFYSVNLPQALAIGVLVGLAYTAVARLLLVVCRRRWARVAARRQEQQQQQQQQGQDDQQQQQDQEQQDAQQQQDVQQQQNQQQQQQEVPQRGQQQTDLEVGSNPSPNPSVSSDVGVRLEGILVQ